jgi:hypothetical protein
MREFTVVLTLYVTTNATNLVQCKVTVTVADGVLRASVRSHNTGAICLSQGL